ncbi:sugar ABC transporter permease [Labrys miyagiensis]|uniref:Sugar ABC transporter permease n=1 Tax=Labrys miyagiensis TaxID=346912 RepID=A0ABQ6CSM2_9HYPH|nr:ABC transporter permease [Labrys miyagiensis]GLS23327.1 sugar ABC transporter permease [Labrys miyagiensis]
MSISAPDQAIGSTHRSGRPSAQLAGGWEAGLLLFMLLIYLVGVYTNPTFFASGSAFGSVLRDAARYGVMACGMTFVIVDKDLDLSVGSTLGLVATIFSISYAQAFFDSNVTTAILVAIAVGVFIGFLNGWLVTVMQVPSFIATLTMLFIGRGFVLGFTGGKTIAYDTKARGDSWFFHWGETNSWGEAHGFAFNNQIVIFLVVAILAAIVLAKTRIGYETYAVGGNEQAAVYAGISSRWVRVRAYVFSALAATLAGLMNCAQNKGMDSSFGAGAELIVIAATIVGGASIAGGRGRVLGACLGAILVELIDVVLRQGIPITRVVQVAGIDMKVQQLAQLPPGAVPAFLGLMLLMAVLIEPYVMQKRVLARLIARLTGRPMPISFDSGGIAISQPATKGTKSQSRGVGVKGWRAFFYRRDAAAIMLALALWLAGLYLRPDFWGSLDNTFNLALAFTEIALLAIGLTFVIANADIDLSVGSVLALSASTAAFLMHEYGSDPLYAVLAALVVGTLAGVLNGALTVRFGMPAFVATLGMFYIARGIGAWFSAGRQLSGFPESYTLLGRKVIELLIYLHMEPGPGFLHNLAGAVSVQTVIMAVIATIAGIILGKTTIGEMVYATGGNLRAAQYSGINVNRVRFLSLTFSAFCSALAGVIYVAYYRSFNPSAGMGRELDGIASVIIGGGSVFGGYGTIIGSLAGAAVITLIRGLLSLQIFLPDGSSFVMPQHWVNVFIGLILIIAVLGDIWIRQQGIVGVWLKALRRKRPSSSVPPVADPAAAD